VGRKRLPPNLIGGVALLAALGLLAVAAPLLATGLPWLVRSDDGLGSPAFRAFLGLSVASPAAAVPLLRAPIPHGPSELALDRVLVSPSSSHWMGTDALGRDIAARVVHGGRVSLGVGVLAAVFALLIGVPLGATAGYLRGWTDASISRLIETVLCFPTLLLVLAVLAAAPAWLRGLSDVPRIALVLGLTGWIPVARYLRGEFMKLRDSPMAQAARALGGSHLRVMARHILPSALAPVLVTAAFAVAAAIVVEASLSFLGLGVRPPVATWGGLLADAREQVDRAWWLAVYPGAALFLAVLGCNLLGEGVRDYLDPRSSRP
jgi:peptide/nickel transport system permease protein